MQSKLTIILFALFFFGFLLSLLLGLLVVLPIYTVFLRATISGFFFVLVGFLLSYIYKNYLSCIFDLSQLFSPSHSDTKEASVPFEDIQEEDMTGSVDTENPDSSESQNVMQAPDRDKGEVVHKFDFPTFSQLKGEKVSQNEPEGLTKVSKDSFQEEDPSLMAEAIRTVIAKGQNAKTSKTERSGS